MNNVKPKEPLANFTTTRKEEVMTVAARLFAAKGYHATTLDEIAEEIVVTKPALYYYVHNKEDILRTIINRMMEPMEEVNRLGQSTLPPKEKMRKIIQILVKFAAERKETTLIAFEQANILPKRSRDALQRRQKEVEKTVGQILKDGIKEGCFADIDTRMTCFAILAVANGLYRWYQPKGHLTPAKIADHFIMLLEHGYVKDG